MGNDSSNKKDSTLDTVRNRYLCTYIELKMSHFHYDAAVMMLENMQKLDKSLPATVVVNELTYLSRSCSSHIHQVIK